MTKWTHVWNKDKWPARPNLWKPGGRKGQRCRILASSGTNASSLIEFEDGKRMISNRRFTRRVK